jgi:hypothetical protein
MPDTRSKAWTTCSDSAPPPSKPPPELRAATTATPGVSRQAGLELSLTADVDWIAANAAAHRAVLQGGLSSDRAVQAIVDAYGQTS